MKAERGRVDLRTFAIIAACCICFMTNACAGNIPRDRARPPVSFTLPAIKKDCVTYHLSTGTAKAGELKKKLSVLSLDCHQDRKAPTDHKVDFDPPGEIRGFSSPTG